ncbi:hypothetical protein [Streptomyces sp. NPDC048489]|uniref:hypothetical protein n=1 Tax=Streptomyces sp. NPDC048489 TaxID=3154504 RepID=UPI003430A809
MSIYSLGLNEKQQAFLLSNRILGQLHHCLTTRQRLDETTAFPAPVLPPLAEAA